MELVSNNPLVGKITENKDLQVEKHKTPDMEALGMVVEAYQAGQIKITRALTYRKTPAKKGHIFYRIKFKQGDQVIYDGAYEMDLVFEEHCKKHDKLNHFLLFQLKGELQNFE